VISLILRMPANTQVVTLPEQAAPQAKQTLDEINASYSFEIMPNSQEVTGRKLLDVLASDEDVLASDEAEFYDFPPSWTVMYMAKLIPVLYDEEGIALNEAWEVITPLHVSFINHLNDDNEGNRPSSVFEPHRFMGLPERF